LQFIYLLVFIYYDVTDLSQLYEVKQLYLKISFSGFLEGYSNLKSCVCWTSHGSPKKSIWEELLFL